MSAVSFGLGIGWLEPGLGAGGAAGGAQGAGDLRVVESGAAGGIGQRAEVGGGIVFESAVGGPEQAGVAVAVRLGRDPLG
jgi:hypothetical protein